MGRRKGRGRGEVGEGGRKGEGGGEGDDKGSEEDDRGGGNIAR